MSYQYYLVGGTRQELVQIAREAGVSPESIRLIQGISDIQGYRGGKIIYGNTSNIRDFFEIIDYAKTHDIELP